MVPKEMIVEMIQFIVLTMNGASVDLTKLPEIIGIVPSDMAKTICASVPSEQIANCHRRAFSITAAYVRNENKIYYNSYVIHPESSGPLGKSFIIHELTHWWQQVDFSLLTCSELKNVELEAYKIQDAYITKYSDGITSNFYNKFSEKFVCYDKN